MDPCLLGFEFFEAYVERIIASQCHRVLRKKAVCSAEPAGNTFRADDLEELGSRKERRRLVREALGQLPATERVAMVLFYFSGKSQAAIATFLGVPETTVVKRLFSARQRLKAALAPLQATIERSRPSRNRQFAALVRAGVYADYVGLYRYDLRPELTVRWNQSATAS